MTLTVLALVFVKTVIIPAIVGYFVGYGLGLLIEGRLGKPSDYVGRIDTESNVYDIKTGIVQGA